MTRTLGLPACVVRRMARRAASVSVARMVALGNCIASCLVLVPWPAHRSTMTRGDSFATLAMALVLAASWTQMSGRARTLRSVPGSPMKTWWPGSRWGVRELVSSGVAEDA